MKNNPQFWEFCVFSQIGLTYVSTGRKLLTELDIFTLHCLSADQINLSFHYSMTKYKNLEKLDSS